ncbi:SDR family NAD(P)-dependent oxidoreductase [Catenuloplanes atrovinosus]|uniref:3-oxoacyl-[acyl-carrier protein] reductase n=1 Tax=Catenuloplanes atrovinosus TaxID=137266 RepID=A0AAE4CA33_9ACTN|nr:SDR family oxidoreductase [Catenuloplanes atrovinosus]MDR7275429.1 3-oxoacyl-[acyl-carrier protein] reductase [Catenuloplanes atrovinosus]
MDLGLHGRTAMVAAATSGIGLAIARRLAREGATVAICGRDPDRLRDAVRELKELAHGAAHGTTLDVTDHTAVSAWVDEIATAHGGPHVVVANAGSPPEGGADRFGLADYRAALDLHLLSAVALTRAALPRMRAAGYGRIIFNTSLAARQPIPGLALSNTVRPAIVGYAKSLVHELAEAGERAVTVNVLAPGMTRTPALQAWADRLDGGLAGLSADIPLGRPAEPDEIAAAAAYLASSLAASTTGVVLPVDGGASRSLL